MKIAILGAGIAGAASAYFLRQGGAEVTVYEAGPSAACGASGNAIGLYNPRFTAARTAESDFYVAAFAMGLRVFGTMPGIDWNPCGALHLMNDAQKQKRYMQTVLNWEWPPAEMKIVNAAQASDLAGVSLEHEALYLPRAGYVSPRKLVARLLEGVDVRLNERIEDPGALAADAVILCNAADAARVTGLPLHTVRGQVTRVQSAGALGCLKKVLCYGGYTTPAHEGFHVVGSSFQKWLSHVDLLPQDDIDNLQKLFSAAPALIGEYPPAESRAALRCASPDHFPVIGRVGPDIFVSAAHGSHGLLSGLLGGALLADMVFNRPVCVSKDSLRALSPLRFKVGLD